jgi:hypothetical protein
VTDALIQNDLQTMLSALNSWFDPVWFAPVKTAAFLAFKFGNHSLNFPNVMGFPIYGSAGSPAQLGLLDLGDVAFAEGETDLSFAESAAIVMDDSPQNSPQTSSLVSMFQRDLVALRVIRQIAQLQDRIALLEKRVVDCEKGNSAHRRHLHRLCSRDIGHARPQNNRRNPGK